jgi:hypothetical protein
VKDEWDQDLLRVTYDAAQVTIAKLQETISSEGFEGEVRRE